MHCVFNLVQARSTKTDFTPESKTLKWSISTRHPCATCLKQSFFTVTAMSRSLIKKCLFNILMSDGGFQLQSFHSIFGRALQVHCECCSHCLSNELDDWQRQNQWIYYCTKVSKHQLQIITTNACDYSSTLAATDNFQESPKLRNLH